MCPDQTYNINPCMYASRLVFMVPSNTHPIAAACKISSGHAINLTIVGLVPLSSYFIRSDVIGGMCPDQTYNFATHV